MLKSKKQYGQIRTMPNNEAIDIGQQENLLELLLKKKIFINHSCGGMGSCGTCRVKVLAGLEQLDDRTEIEQDMANDRKFEQNERLACQIVAKDGLVIKIPEDN